jgi:nucleotide-binding universal stress UspA family protein
MYRSILVPLDGSEFGEQALPLALSIARRAGASLRLVHVAIPLVTNYAEAFVMPDDLEARVRARQADYLNETASRLLVSSLVPVTTALLDGDVVTAIRDHAAAAGVDLVVMTTHGRGPLGRFWLGSVADELVRRLPIPLLLVRPSDRPPEPGHEPVLRHLLIPLDGSPLAEQIIEPAVALGTLMDADYTLLRVLEPMLPVGYPLEGGTIGEATRKLLDQVQTAHEELRREARRYLAGIAEDLQERGLHAQVRVTTADQPAAAILDAATPPACDLVAVETHGRRGLTRVLLGSVADKLIRGAPVPVLVHRPIQT